MTQWRNIDSSGDLMTWLSILKVYIYMSISSFFLNYDCFGLLSHEKSLYSNTQLILGEILLLGYSTKNIF